MGECPRNVRRFLRVTLNMNKEIKKPDCVGFIMDGNRRWAKEQDLPTLEGHRKGYEVCEEVVKWVRDEGVAHAVFYAFSTENWNRSEEEVSYLMELLALAINNFANNAEELKVSMRVIGDRSRLSPSLIKAIENLEATTEKYQDTTIWVALSYGGRLEIVEGINKAIEKGEKVSEEDFKKLLWSSEMPDPDIIVRTGGEQRLSNFMTWGSVYSELLFLDKYWPALIKSDLDGILTEYERRARRHGV